MLAEQALAHLKNGLLSLRGGPESPYASAAAGRAPGDSTLSPAYPMAAPDRHDGLAGAGIIVRPMRVIGEEATTTEAMARQERRPRRKSDHATRAAQATSDPPREASRIVVHTIGHSTRSLREFMELLIAHRITTLLDVRSAPRSRRNPQFNRETLPQALAAAGVEYVHARGLGGFRRAGPASPNTGWRNMSFRGYADYMQTEEFVERLNELLRRAASERVVLMCAEAVPWRCHRSLIADALVVRGVEVREIVDAKRTQAHTLTPFARVDGEKLTYPPVE
ncbi:MAG: DUF488 domain-containing protein [Steroidobacteraceae bacterium]|jgi:hypothetical protein|nr:DUF488 domain-containing protein [Steroidobacteraceae bacterium]